MLTAAQVQAARDAAIEAGFPNPGPATIALYAFNPAADAAAVVEALKAIAPAVDAATVNSDLAAMQAEAEANKTSAQVVGAINQVADVMLPVIGKAVGL